MKDPKMSIIALLIDVLVKQVCLSPYKVTLEPTSICDNKQLS